MKKIISLFLFCLLLISCVEKKIYHKNQVFYTDDGTCIVKSNQKPLNGFLTSNFGDIGLYKKGKREGNHSDYYDSGILKLRGNFKKGDHYEGTLLEYKDESPSGLSPILEQNKFRGKLHGRKTYYRGNTKRRYDDTRYEEEYKMGIIQWRIVTTHNGNTKLSHEYFTNGKKWKETSTSLPSKFYNQSGYKETKHYKEGKLHGKWTRTDLGGRLILEYFYNYGKVTSKKCYNIKLGGEELDKQFNKYKTKEEAKAFHKLYPLYPYIQEEIDCDYLFENYNKIYHYNKD